jgi:carnitine O-acetyltransferase
MFDFSAATEALAGRGYLTEKLDGLLPQRNFATIDERNQILGKLTDAGVDPSGYEDLGTYFAEVYVSRPIADAAAMPLAEMVTINPD